MYIDKPTRVWGDGKRNSGLSNNPLLLWIPPGNSWRCMRYAPLVSRSRQDKGVPSHHSGLPQYVSVPVDLLQFRMPLLFPSNVQARLRHATAVASNTDPALSYFLRCATIRGLPSTISAAAHRSNPGLLSVSELPKIFWCWSRYCCNGCCSCLCGCYRNETSPRSRVESDQWLSSTRAAYLAPHEINHLLKHGVIASLSCCRQQRTTILSAGLNQLSDLFGVTRYILL